MGFLISPPAYNLKGLNVYPYIQGIFRKLLDNDVRIGIISNTGEETVDTMKKVLEDCNLYSFFDNKLLIYSSVVGYKKDSPEIFQIAVNRADLSANPEHYLFVGEDSKERSFAMKAGLLVAPHPCLAWEVLNGSSLRYIRITVSAKQCEKEWRKVLRGLSVVPLYVTGEKGTKVYAIATSSVAATLDDMGFGVDRLGSNDDPLTTKLYLLRDDRQSLTGFLSPEGHSSIFFNKDEESQWVLTSSQEGLYIALPASRSVEEFHFEKAYHGHNLKLMPDMCLLEPFGLGNNARSASFLQPSTEEPSFCDQELEKFRKINSEMIRTYLERYSGKSQLDRHETIKIMSRHIHSSDNAIVTEALANELQKIGECDFSVSINQFVHEGQELDNVEAELKWNQSDEIVLISAHLDSTAAFSRPYNSKKDPAPGADDDCSGVAAVLAIANVIKDLIGTKKPKRTIRFLLFNAEEHGLIGIKACARNQATIASPIIAVYQIDMIGYNVKPPRSFEAHVGYRPSDDVRERSLVLAKRIQTLIEQVSQIFLFKFTQVGTLWRIGAIMQAFKSGVMQHAFLLKIFLLLHNKTHLSLNQTPITTKKPIISSILTM